MVFSDVALLLLCLSFVHLASVPLVVVRFSPLPAYIAAGIALRHLRFPAPSELWGDMATFLLTFVGLQAGLSLRIGRGEIKKIAYATAANVLISVATSFLLIYPILADPAKALLISLLLANTATEGVVALAKHVRYEADSEVALRISIGDDVVVLVAFSIALPLCGLQPVSPSLLLALASATAIAAALRFSLVKSLSVELVNVLVTASLLTAAGLTLDTVGPLIGGYFVGIALSSLRFSGDPLLRMARHVEVVAESLEVMGRLVALPLVFSYVGFTVAPGAANQALVLAGLAGAVAGKAAVVLALSKVSLIDPLSRSEVTSLISVRGALESALALAALKLGVMNVEEFSSTVLISLLTYPTAVALLALSRALGRKA